MSPIRIGCFFWHILLSNWCSEQEQRGEVERCRLWFLKLGLLVASRFDTADFEEVTHLLLNGWAGCQNLALEEPSQEFIDQALVYSRRLILVLDGGFWGFSTWDQSFLLLLGRESWQQCGFVTFCMESSASGILEGLVDRFFFWVAKTWKMSGVSSVVLVSESLELSMDRESSESVISSSQAMGRPRVSKMLIECGGALRTRVVWAIGAKVIAVREMDAAIANDRSAATDRIFSNGAKLDLVAVVFAENAKAGSDMGGASAKGWDCGQEELAECWHGGMEGGGIISGLGSDVVDRHPVHLSDELSQLPVFIALSQFGFFETDGLCEVFWLANGRLLSPQVGAVEIALVVVHEALAAAVLSIIVVIVRLSLEGSVELRLRGCTADLRGG
ncbi:hypothetical protein F5148DRAFT_1154107 [Russula earlei]|uniref:Uncharacterized protein n=1 Tax=Russula earlei TaxID=71964 RepID=A0ACC0TS66_9AGAM|nr:hypothetical protein F5148DRAFT_1154107 [Russula earlei]